jgi:Ca2+-binding EF-hand superfamily protein
MKTLKLFLGVILAIAVITSISNVSAQKHPRHEMKCEDNFTKMDTDKDGKVSLKEFMAVKHPGGNPEDIFKSRDTDKDGSLTREEFCKEGMKHGKSMGKGR